MVLLPVGCLLFLDSLIAFYFKQPMDSFLYNTAILVVGYHFAFYFNCFPLLPMKNSEYFLKLMVNDPFLQVSISSLVEE